MFEPWVLKEMEWAITPAKPDSIIVKERKCKLFFMIVAPVRRIVGVVRLEP
jgi:hypothetical protein